MIVALDFDGCADTCPEVWFSLIHNMRSVGNEVYLVTMRYPSETNKLIEKYKSVCNGVVFTERLAKDKVCRERFINVDVWIDDHPQAVHSDASEIWEHVVPENEVDKFHEVGN